MAELQLSQRDIEGALEDLSVIYERIEDCDDPDTLRGYVSTIESVRERLKWLAVDWQRMAETAEEEEEEDSPECSSCGRSCFEGGGEHDDTGICEDCVENGPIGG